VGGASDLTQNVFAAILGQIQIHQNQIRNCGIRPGPLTSDESERLISGGQVDQLKPEILLLQRPIEKEDIGAVVFNYDDSSYGYGVVVFQSFLPSLFIIPQFTVPAFAAHAPDRAVSGAMRF
jgi:hypothetical protein